MTTRLILVRHGQSTSNVRRIATSALDGYPLTGTGRAQAAAVAGTLAGLPVDHVYSSQVQRARQTAWIIRDQVGAPLTEVPGLEEIDVGLHEGWSEDGAAVDGQTNFERWLSHGDLDHGFAGGETAHQASARVTEVLTDLAGRHPGGTVVVVSHGAALALALVRLCHNVEPAFVWENLLDNCAVVNVSVDESGWTCTSWAGRVPVPGTSPAVDAG